MSSCFIDTRHEGRGRSRREEARVGERRRAGNRRREQERAGKRRREQEREGKRRRKKRRSREHERAGGEMNSNANLSLRTQYAAAVWSVLNLRVTQVMGEIASAGRLLNCSAGSIYLRPRRSSEKKPPAKWESTARLSPPHLPSGHFYLPPIPPRSRGQS